jgi:hypothetical protein
VTDPDRHHREPAREASRHPPEPASGADRHPREPAPGTDWQFPPGRYGRRRDPDRRRGRWAAYLLAGLVIVAGTAIALKLYRQYAQPPYQVHLISVTGLADNQVTVTFEVRKPPGRPALCTVLAHTRNGEEVGNAEVRVPAGAPDETTARITYTLKTTKRPVTGEVPGCGPAG